MNRNVRYSAVAFVAGLIAASAAIVAVKMHKHRESASVDGDGVRYAEGSYAYRAANRYAHLPEKDRKIAEAIQSACDEENPAEMKKLSDLAKNSANVEVRSAAVDALVWFDARFIEELIGWFGDSNSEIAETARNGFDMALPQIESPYRRLLLSERVLKMKIDGEFRDAIEMQFVSAANDLMDADEEADRSEKTRRQMVRKLIAMISDTDPEVSASAKRMYKEITSGSWKNTEDAEKYIKDPDKYASEASEEGDDEN